MRYGDHLDFLASNLIDDAVRKSAQEIATVSAPKWRTNPGVDQERLCCTLEFRNEGVTKFSIGACGVEGCGIVQLSKRKRNDDQIHFNAART
jgi:hypothetical protein